MSDSRLLNRNVLYQGRKLRFVEEHFKLADGREARIEKVEHPGAVVILPVERDGRLVVLRQYRQAVGKSILEFPAGTREGPEDPLLCAKRELAEEISAAASEWVDLGLLYPAPGFCDELQFCFFARDLSPASAAMDEDEQIEVLRMSVPEVENAITGGEILDGKSVAIFCRARLRGLI